MISLPADRPVVVAVCGPNGAGKSTFYEAFLAPSALRFVNADDIARELSMDAYAAAKMATRIRDELVSRGESFIFETVLSDPVGEKVSQMVEWQRRGYAVVLCFIGLADAGTSDTRVTMRVSQGGHDVPVEKLKGRFPRTLENLKRAISALDHVLVYDNSDLRSPYRLLARFESGVAREMEVSVPPWFKRLLSRK
ncbi:MAG TPA: zeta toxin family protein [Chthoniobacterales bacterium]